MYSFLSSACQSEDCCRSEACSGLGVKFCNLTLGIGRFCLLVSPEPTADGGVVNTKVGDEEIESMSDIIHLHRVSTDWCGPDLLYESYLSK